LKPFKSGLPSSNNRRRTKTQTAEERFEPLPLIDHHEIQDVDLDSLLTVIFLKFTFHPSDAFLAGRALSPLCYRTQGVHPFWLPQPVWWMLRREGGTPQALHAYLEGRRAHEVADRNRGDLFSLARRCVAVTFSDYIPNSCFSLLVTALAVESFTDNVEELKIAQIQQANASYRVQASLRHLVEHAQAVASLMGSEEFNSRFTPTDSAESVIELLNDLSKGMNHCITTDAMSPMLPRKFKPSDHPLLKVNLEKISEGKKEASKRLSLRSADGPSAGPSK
jgi:hypothetical protein